MGAYTREEWTVTLNYDYMHKKWDAYTNIPSYRDRLLKRGWTLVKEGKLNGESIDWFFTIDYGKAITFRDINKARGINIPSDEDDLSDPQKTEGSKG